MAAPASVSCFSACKGRAHNHPLSYDFQFLTQNERILIEETTRERLSTIQTHIQENLAKGQTYMPTPPVTPIDKHRKRRLQRQKSIFGNFTFKVGKMIEGRSRKARMLKRSATLLTAELEGSERFKDLQEGAERVFGVKLDKTVKHQQKKNPDSRVPSILLSLRDALTPYLEEEGLFRIPAKSSQLKELQILIEDEFNVDEPDDFKWDDVPPHCLAALFKLYFKNLPIPLLTFKLHSEILEMCKAGVFDRLPEVLAKMPKSHQDTLDFVVDFLCEVAACEANKMDILSLAIVISPNMLRPLLETPESILQDSKYIYLVVVNLLEEQTAQSIRERMARNVQKRRRRRSSVPERGRFGDLLSQELERSIDLSAKDERRTSYWLRKQRAHTKSLGESLESVEL